MFKQPETGTAPTERLRRLAILALLSLTLMTAVALFSADQASASSEYVPVDSDGSVPVYSVCHSGYGYLAYYVWTYDGYAVSGAIYVDDCLLAQLGAGPHDRQMVIAHEQGHSVGLPHSSDPASYMYPYYSVTGT